MDGNTGGDDDYGGDCQHDFPEDTGMAADTREDDLPAEDTAAREPLSKPLQEPSAASSRAKGGRPLQAALDDVAAATARAAGEAPPPTPKHVHLQQVEMPSIRLPCSHSKC